MGAVRVTVAISNLARTKKGFEDTFLVDTGYIDCMAPAGKLKKAGIREEGRDAYELANGQPVEYAYGFARVSFMGSETIVRIIFGPEGTEPILGVVALEDVGIAVDPVSRTLKKMTAKSLKGVRH
ncbi:MAG: clan AA aspartic protease [Elusimicrobia bacterium]|nr:clan AA aspartic protease [Elusimicrobiota bacterium]